MHQIFNELMQKQRSQNETFVSSFKQHWGGIISFLLCPSPELLAMSARGNILAALPTGVGETLKSCSFSFTVCGGKADRVRVQKLHLKNDAT